MQVVPKSCWGPTSKSGVVWTRDKYLAILVESHLAISKISNKDSTWQFLTNRTRCVTTGRGTRHRGILQLMEIPFIKFSKALTVSFIHKVGLQWRLGYLPTETYPVESQLTWTLLELQILIIAFSLWGKKKKTWKRKTNLIPTKCTSPKVCWCSLWLGSDLCALQKRTTVYLTWFPMGHVHISVYSTGAFFWKGSGNFLPAEGCVFGSIDIIGNAAETHRKCSAV